jgi:hypothetical protein
MEKYDGAQAYLYEWAMPPRRQSDCAYLPPGVPARELASVGGVFGWASGRSELEVLAPPGLGGDPMAADALHVVLPPLRRFSGTALGRALRYAQEPGCVPSGQQGRHAASIARGAPS